MTSFSELKLIPSLMKALAAEGYETPTPIQTQAIPHLLAGKDLLGIAQTGTGKTAAFALPILQYLADKPYKPDRGTCKALILSPTRELAAQIGQSFKTYGKFLRLNQAVVFGGVSINAQIRTLQAGVDILVATPGRLVDLIDRRAVSLAKVEVFVLDEADQMLDLGFIHAIRKLTGMLPRERQNLFFSATMPKEIATLAAGLLKDPARVEVTPSATTVERIEQAVIHVPQKDKPAVLIDLLKNPDMSRTLVFTRTKHGADKVTKSLEAAKIGANAIHGNKSQGQRERALADFKNGKCRVLVATDIAARGIDIDSVSHVVNFDLPHVAESYVHRIGRTARAGAGGNAIAFCDPEERALLRDIEKLTRQVVPVLDHPMGLAAPKPGDRMMPRPPMRPQAQQRPQSHGKPKRPGENRWSPTDAPRAANAGGGKPSWMKTVGKGGGAKPAGKDRAVSFGS